MKRLVWGLALCLSAFLLAPAYSTTDAAWVRKEFKETDAAFSNPGQGWMTQQRAPGKSAPRFPYSNAYIRFNWMDAEPAEGQYNWKVLDDAIAAWKPQGATISFRVMTCSAHSSGYYCSPKWLFDAGCKSYDYEPKSDDPTAGGKRIKRVEPEYSDPIYLAKHGAFIAALGKRYDGHPGIEFLDIGSYGVLGEWHTPHAASLAVRRQIVDMYLRAFKKTPLVMMSDDAETLPYALQNGAGMRRDGVGSPWHEQNWIGSKKYAAVPAMAEAWKKSPIVFEWFGNYDYLQQRKWSFDAAVNFMLNNHVTFINDNIGNVPPEAMPRLMELARRAGYRFVLREISYPASAKAGSNLDVKMKWANVGVGKLYRPYQLRLELLDASSGAGLGARSNAASGAVSGAASGAVSGADKKTAVSFIAKAEPREWLTGDHEITEHVAIGKDIKPGDYTLAISLVDPDGARPAIKLAIDAPARNGRYEMGAVRVEF
ncbi:MAG: DUF4832 domain-containing protein [Candidatus Sumerlaeota bacterium]|nr:DUF4832 domain-containing protein [Candidatus Sumerlaeota bacterium]